MRHVLQIVLVVAIGMLGVTVNAQRGTGSDTGVAQQIGGRGQGPVGGRGPGGGWGLCR